jgi:hypothetical protein
MKKESKIKFNKCFVPLLDRLYKLDELITIHAVKEQKFFSIKDDLFCPSCQIARLVFYPNSKSPHLQTKSNSKHQNECIYNFESCTRKEVREYRSDRQKPGEIKSKLNSLLDTLERPSSKTVSGIPEFSNSEESAEDNVVIKPKEKRRFRKQKSLTSRFEESDFDFLTLFYGHVEAKWFNHHKSKRWCLLIRNMNTGVDICSVWMSDNVYNYIEPLMKFGGWSVCNVAFFGELRRQENYNNIDIYHSTELVIRVKQNRK